MSQFRGDKRITHLLQIFIAHAVLRVGDMLEAMSRSVSDTEMHVPAGGE
jgi:hypothetical protein